MSDETERPDLDAVRRLLAEARHDEPVPDDVAARLDRVLAGLSQEATGADARVLPLEVHRRRRAAGLLVAAAAIVVGGVALAQHHPQSSGGAAATASGGQDRLNADNGGAVSKTPATQPHVPGPEASMSAGRFRTVHGRVLVRPSHFTADAVAGRRATTPSAGDSSQALRLKEVSPGCVPSSVGDAVVVPATYKRAPAALVYHAPAGTTQVVDLYVCGTARPVRSVTLPTP